LDIYQLYFNCKFVRLSHSFIKGYLQSSIVQISQHNDSTVPEQCQYSCWFLMLIPYQLPWH